MSYLFKSITWAVRDVCVPGNAQVIAIKMFSLHLLFSSLFTLVLGGCPGGKMSQQSQPTGTVAFGDIDPFFPSGEGCADKKYPVLVLGVWGRQMCWTSCSSDCQAVLLYVHIPSSLYPQPLPSCESVPAPETWLCTASTKLCNYIGNSHSKWEEEKREGREQLPSLLTWRLFFFPPL